MRVQWSPVTLRQRREIARYIAQDNIDAALALLDTLTALPDDWNLSPNLAILAR